MSHALHQVAADYLSMRRALGFKLEGYDRLLTDFLGCLERRGETTITVRAALAWASAPAGASPGRQSDRLCVVRGFARHLSGIDPSVEVPPSGLLGSRRQRRIPNLYSDADIARLMGAAGNLQPPLRGATYETLFGLLGVTGMRVGEAISLDRADVDVRSGLVEINDAKFRKHRLLPLHATTVAALRDYAAARDRLCPSAETSSFFVSARGKRLLYGSVRDVFRQLVEDLGLAGKPGAGPPRIHHLRHSFAVAQVRDWHREGADPQGKLPMLSAYLGHADPAYTYWYLQACPELLSLATQRLERFEEGRP